MNISTEPQLRKITLRWLVIALSVCGLCACRSELYEHLDERDSNELLAALYAAGIHAQKVTRDEKTWAVEVEERELPNAVRVAAEHGLPREQFASVGALFKKEGLVSTPSEERIRYIYAVSQELSNTLSQIDGVIVARVHPVIPANDPLATQIRPASASVFIKYRKDVNVEALAPPIKNLVMRSIEGLEYENIALTFVPAEELAHERLPVRQPEVTVAKSAIGGFALLFLFALAGLGYAWNHRHRIARIMPVGNGAAPPAGQSWASRVR